ncbi:EF-hand domain-containing protein [Streptomyces sp. t39]|uniref:EF-hand domain-containing protein n=1 Tax=Streptomyces sp. t39 TaxID=1828156 RepID=UPI001650302E|nr:EF-hand domain-containing protein [Streptomyces sp. t39]
MDISQEKMQAAFEAIDADGDGLIGPREYYHFLQKHGGTSMEAIEAAHEDFLGADQNWDNYIQFSEFADAVSRWCRNKNSNDPDVRLVEAVFQRF